MTAANLKDRVDAVADKLDRMGSKVEGLSIAGGSLSYFEDSSGSGQYGISQVRSRAAYDQQIKRGNLVQHLSELRAKGYRNAELKSFQAQLRGVAAQAKQTEDGRSYQAAYQEATGSLARAVGLNTFEGDSAGSLVLPEFAPSIMDREFNIEDLWNRADGYVVAGNSMTFPKARNTDRRDGKRNGGLDHFWVGEEKEIGTVRPGIDDFTLRLKKLAVIVFVTEELIADESYALQQYVTAKVRDELDYAMSNATVRGTAVLQPMGWLNSSATITQLKVNLQAAATVVAENILAMWNQRITGHDSDYVWLINQEVERQLPQMTLGAGNLGGLVYIPAGGLAGAQHATLMGAPVITTEYNSALGTKGDIMLVNYADYKTISKGGVTETASPHVEFLRDQIAYKFTVRVDGRPCEDEPITPANGTTKQSSCIVLETRA